MAVGVVVRRPLAEVAQPADEVRRVGPDELDHRGELLQRRDRVRERGLGGALERRRLRSRSVRSLPAPLRCTSVFRSATVGRASCTSGRSWLRKRARSLVAGLDAATRTSRSSSVARRLTKVVLALRRVPGSSSRRLVERRVLVRDRRRRRVGVGDEVGEVASARGQRAGRLGRVDQEAVERLLIGDELVHQPSRRAQRGVEVLRGRVGLDAAIVVPRRAALDDVLQRLARLGVQRVEELVEIDDRRRLVGPQRGAVGQRGIGVRPRRQRDVAVGDARERGRPDQRRRPLVQRRVGLLDRDRDLGLVVVGQRDLADRADAPAADLHVVVLDELPGVLEAQLVGGAAVASQQQDGDDGDGEDERAQRHAARRVHARPFRITDVCRAVSSGRVMREVWVGFRCVGPGILPGPC